MSALMSLIALAGCTPGPVAPGDPAIPDVVLVSIDTLRADHLGSYGYERPTSPFMDRLAAEGLRWEHARAPSPWTLPSHVTMLSGLLPHHHLAVEDDIGIAPGIALLAESMKAGGFSTAGFTSTLFVSRKYGFERGFDHFDDGGIETSKQNLAGDVTATDVVDQALKWLRRREAGEPVFLFLHFYDTHYAYDPPPPYDTMFDRAPTGSDPKYRKYHHYLEHPLTEAQLAHQVAQYDEAIRYVDSELERLHGAMAEGGRRATWLITADHGEEFGERGSWGHAHTLYPEQLRVPLILSGERLSTRGVAAQVVGLEDIAPTLATLSGAQLPAADGRPLDLDPAAEPLPGRRFLAETSRFATQRVGLWQDGARLDIDLAADARELYLTANDPQERYDQLLDLPHPHVEALALEAQLWRALGEPWEQRQAGRVRAGKGTLVRDGRPVAGAQEIPAGERFAVFPLDSEISHSADPTRYRAGETLPGPEAPLAFHGRRGEAVWLSPEERARLEALGYIQGE
jgi:arylsulfatase A-like enzyme